MDTISYSFARSMLDAIPKLHDAIVAFRKDQSRSVFADSPATRETNAFPDPEIIRTGLSQGYAHIDVAGDHLIAFTRTLTEPVQTFAPWACVRCVLETGALAAWFLDPSIDAHERAKRSFAFRFEGLTHEIKFLNSIKAKPDRIDSLEKRIEETESAANRLGFQSLRDKNGKRNGIGMVMPSITGLISQVLRDEPTYRLLSAMTHGHHWALLQLGYRRDESDDGKSDYARITQHISGSSVGYLSSHALKAYLRPVWYRSHLNGWDLERLRHIADSAYDSMRLNEKDRFWRTEGRAATITNGIV